MTRRLDEKTVEDVLPAFRRALARAIAASNYERSLPEAHPDKAKAKAAVILANIAVKAAADELRGRR